jgi:hypothetical protein
LHFYGFDQPLLADRQVEIYKGAEIVNMDVLEHVISIPP